MMCWFAFWEAFYRDLYWAMMASAMPEAKMLEDEFEPLHLVESPQ